MSKSSYYIEKHRRIVMEELDLAVTSVGAWIQKYSACPEIRRAQEELDLMEKIRAIYQNHKDITIESESLLMGIAMQSDVSYRLAMTVPGNGKDISIPHYTRTDAPGEWADVMSLRME